MFLFILEIERFISDHQLNSCAIQNQSYERKVWLYRNAYFDTLNTFIQSTDWNSLINEATDILVDHAE